MDFWISILRVLDTRMDVPQPYGLFHLVAFAFFILAAVLLCATHKPGDLQRVRRVVQITAVTVLILEIYKQINFTFQVVDDALVIDYPWYAFPFQFCSTPMYVGLLAGFTRKGRFHHAMCAYLATYAVFAGLCVMCYPNNVFVPTIGINIQTMICHGSMITVGVYLLYSGYVKLEHKTILKALPVFVGAVIIAMALNEVAYVTGLLETDGFNMFYISPHCEPHLPIYSLIQRLLPYPVCLVIYVCGFTLAAYLMLLIAMGISRLAKRRNNKQLASI